VGGQRHVPAALAPGKTQYPLYRRLGGPQGRSGRERKTSPLPGFDPRNLLCLMFVLYSPLLYQEDGVSFKEGPRNSEWAALLIDVWQ